MNTRVACFGEILWDLLPDGPALGGAPFNLAFRMTELGRETVMISAVGTDELGDRTLAAVKEMGLTTDCIQRVAEYPTGTVEVAFDEEGEPDYTIIQDVAYDHITYEQKLDALTTEVDCICYGTLAQRSARSRRTLAKFLERAEANEGALRFLDINLRKNCYDQSTIEESLKRADILKTNDAETRMLADFFELETEELSEIANDLVARWGLDYCVVTLGPQGAVCADKEGKFHYSPGYQVDVVDPCGSGDAFSAGFLHEIMNGSGVEEACRFGNLLGAAVASQHSATQSVTAEHLERVASEPSDRVVDPAFVQ